MTTFFVQMAFSSVALYLVCVSTLMAALQAFTPVPSTETPSYASQDSPLQPGVELSPPAEQLCNASHAGSVALSWRKEVWPGGGGGGGGLGMDLPTAHLLLKPQHAVNSRPPLGVGGMLNDTPLTWKWKPASLLSCSWLQYAPQQTLLKDPGQLTKTQEARGSLAHTESLNSSASVPPPTCPALYHDHTPHRERPHCRGSYGEPVFEARVDSFQAEDLGYHHGGTYHWDPVINASSLLRNGSTMSGALTLIVHYFTPHWVS